jgi:transposase
MGDMGAGSGMLVVETIAKIRRAYFAQKKPIKAICREFRLSRKVVRKVIRSGATEFRYERGRQPLPRIDPWRDQLDALLLANEGKAARERLTLIRMFEELRGLGYQGSYDAVRRYAKKWRVERGAATAEAYVPLSFAPGEAYQFDWSHEVVLINGTTVTVKVAHVRLCHSRMLFVRAYPRETQEMVFDAHVRAFAFFKGTCTRGIYDNMKTAVETVFIGKDRQYNRRFVRMCGHYLVDPVACTPASGWEKGQVENQVGVVRERFFTPRLRVASYDELNAWLLDRCVAYAKAHKHPELPDRTIWQAFEAERAQLVPISGPFDGFHATQAAVSKTCLVRFDNNKYSVASRRGPAGRDPGLCRSYRDPSGRCDRRRAPALLWSRRDDLRSLALRAGARQEAGCAAQRRAVQGLAVAGQPGAGAAQTEGLGRRRPPDGQGAVGGAHRWPRCG